MAQSKLYTEKDYYDLPENIRAELINGSFYYMVAPGRLHQEVLNFLNTEINLYIRSKKGSCKIYPAPFAVKLFESRDTIVEPDISVICDPARLTDRGCTGAPDLVIEIISPSTASHDYIRKLNLYSDAGVREYWIADPKLQSIFTYLFQDNDLQVGNYTFKDRVKVNIFDDLYIDFTNLSLY